ncbi:LOW QUALITY PROTEIN: urocortin-3 [Antechinus flavipes]|uniref:LOW QUALITY PROTEIN: urocortin-3 n=1 Tax=Antechinus flavipes TaxID=38775 RepID=UPI00223592B0|nr:LOW QUALITY PROTEIN: urocortin-3 [Antechinus flavipes]
MLFSVQFLFLLLLLGTSRTSNSHKLYQTESIFRCINAALSGAKNQLDDGSSLSKRSFGYIPSEELSSEKEDKKDKEEDEEDKEKRTLSGRDGIGAGIEGTRYKYQSQAQLTRKLYQNKAQSDRRTKFTLSLDVPTNIMNILFNIAKAKNLKAKAAANAHLMAQIGRRK